MIEGFRGFDFSLDKWFGMAYYQVELIILINLFYQKKP